jgi:UDP-N-acetylglucosamine transferase subunit ALG13
LKICFASSTGGHLNQLKELIGKIDYDDSYFVTEKNTFSESLLKKKEVYFVINPKRDIIKFVKNFLQSWKIYKNKRPDIIITTGTNTAFATCMIAKLFGKKVIFIESFAKVDTPTLFGRIVSPFANLTIIQWKKLLKYYPKAIYGGPIFDFNKSSNTKKEEKIFLTVGSSDYKFDRMIRDVDKIAKKINIPIFAQIGNSDYIPKNFKYKRYLTIDQIDHEFKTSKYVISHAGTGSIVDALTNKCKIMVIPRYKQFGEHIDDHQIEIARELDSKKIIVACYKNEDIIRKFKLLKSTKKLNITSNVVKIIKSYMRKAQI